MIALALLFICNMLLGHNLEPLDGPTRKLSAPENYYNFLQQTKPSGFVLFITKYYLEVKKIDPSYRSPKGNSYLHVAAAFDHTNLIPLFIDLGLDVNAQNEEGKTPLHIAIMRDQLNVAIELVDAGANLALPDHNEITPVRLVQIKISQSPQIHILEKLNELYNRMLVSLGNIQKLSGAFWGPPTTTSAVN